MSVPQSEVLEFPAMLHGLTGSILREVRAKGRGWTQEYIKTGGFAQPQRVLQVPPGELLLMHSAAEFDIVPHPRWRIHLFADVFTSLNEGVPNEERQRVEATFESFCLSTPWGALYHAVAPPPPRSAKRMAKRLTALLRCWDVLQGPRYAYRVPDTQHTLGELMDYMYRSMLEAWCPGGPDSVRDHMSMTVERMARASQEDCLQAVLRLIPIQVKANPRFKHRDVLSDPGFLRDRLTALPAADFEDVSSAYRYAVNGPLCAWDRELERKPPSTPPEGL